MLKTLYTGKIHAKLILAEACSGERIVVESSANANMNPRCEQSVVSVSPELHEFSEATLKRNLTSTSEKNAARKY